MLDTIKSHYKNFGKFAVVGIINTLLDFAIFYILYDIFDFNYVVAHVSAFSFAVINSFIFNAIWTFKNLKQDQLFKQVAAFVLVACLGLLFSTMAIQLAAPYMNIYIAKILAIFLSMSLNYIGSWIFVFKD